MGFEVESKNHEHERRKPPSAAQGGQILTNRKTLSKIEGIVEAEPVGELELKGFARPVAGFNIVRLRD